MDKYNVQKTPQVDWKGILYGSGMYRKLIICAIGQTFQLVRRAGAKMSVYFWCICLGLRHSITPIEPINITSPIGAIISWSAATRLERALKLMG